MSFNMKIYTCDKCGRTDIGEKGFVHKCPETNNTYTYECLYDIDDFFGRTLFEKGKIYKCLEQNDSKIMLNHNLYSKEYDYFDVNWVLENFKPLK